MHLVIFNPKELFITLHLSILPLNAMLNRRNSDRTLEEGLIQHEKDGEEGHVSGRPKIWKVYSRRKKTGPGNIN